MGVAGVARAPPVACGALITIAIAISSPPVTICSCSVCFDCRWCELDRFSSNIHAFPADCYASVLYNGFNANFMLAFYTGCRGLNAKAVRCSLEGELPVKLIELGG